MNRKEIKTMKSIKISRNEKKEVIKFIKFIEEVVERYHLNNAMISERIDDIDGNVGKAAFRRNFTMVRDNIINNLALLKVQFSNKDRTLIKRKVADTLDAYLEMVKFVTSYYIDYNEIENGIEYVKDENIIELKKPNLQFYDSQKFKQFDTAMRIMRRLSYYNPSVRRDFEVSLGWRDFRGKDKRYWEYYHSTMKLINFDNIVNNLRLLNRRFERLNTKSFL